MAFRHETRNNAAIGQISSQANMQSRYLHGTLSSKQRKSSKAGEFRDEVLFEKQFRHSNKHSRHSRNSQNERRSNTSDLDHKSIQKFRSSQIPDPPYLPSINENKFISIKRFCL